MTSSSNVGVGALLAQSPRAVGAARGISPSTYTSRPSESCRWQGLGQSKGTSGGNQNCPSTVALLHLGSTASIRSTHDTILGISDGRVLRPPRARQQVRFHWIA